METTTVIFDCPVPPLVAAVAAFALVAAALVFLRRDAARLSRARKAVILVLVAAAGLALGGLVLSPTLIRTWPDPQKPRCAVLVDASRSMLLADDYTGETAAWLKQHLAAGENPAGQETKPAGQETKPAGQETKPAGRQATREEIARALLAPGPTAWTTAIAREFDLGAWRFASAVEGLALGEGAAPFQVIPEGYSTALGDALEEAAGSAGALRPRAVVLVSDGAWNAGRDPSEVARRLGQLGVAVYVVGVGDPDPPRDVSVLGLRGPTGALLGDEVFLTARIAATGMGAARLPVELVSDGKTIDRKEVVALPSGRPVNVNFTFVPDTPGRRVFEVRVAPQEGERDPANNSARLALEVAERKLSVLLADSEPRWEFRFLRNVLERDPAVKLSLFLLRPGTGPIAGEGYLGQLPIEKNDLAAYDLVILGDIECGKMPEAFLSGLADMVKRRAGALIVIAGKHENYRGLAAGALGPILPVMLDGAGGAEPGLPAPFSPELTQEGAASLVTRLAANPEDNELVWSRLPQLRWSAGVGGLARGASALLVHPYRLAGPGKMPLLAVQRVGEGKVMFLGIEETWRWRREVGDEYHYRFWAQAVRWMTRKQFTEGDPRARLSIDRTECDVGESVQVEAYCLGPDGFPLQDAAVWLKVTDDAGRSEQVAMQPAPGGWGIWRAPFTPSRPAAYRMQPIVSAYGTEPLPATVSLQAARVDLEKDFLAQNSGALKAIAEASGGRYLSITEADQLPTMLAARREQRSITAEYSPCRHWAWYSVLVAALGAAWLVRKRSGLA
jgi:hypothetical protein